mmetsp:Transcript_3102/g.9690  ORF Transcript_3102/g.9690 Transcript_3102/m.9690 type:complete len:84 (+) Transcript_3102:188-439(+)
MLSSRARSHSEQAALRSDSESSPRVVFVGTTCSAHGALLGSRLLIEDTHWSHHSSYASMQQCALLNIASSLHAAALQVHLQLQ